eukprot:Awhi_evm1s8111
MELDCPSDLAESTVSASPSENRKTTAKQGTTTNQCLCPNSKYRREDWINILRPDGDDKVNAYRVNSRHFTYDCLILRAGRLMLKSPKSNPCVSYQWDTEEDFQK